MARPLKVLLIEDSDFDASLILLELRDGGYEPMCERVETVEAMNDALDRQSWDVVIADYVLPRFSGPGALKLLQARGLDLPFIIVSGHIDEDTAVASMKAGAHDYVMKDRLARLVPAIEREMQEAAMRVSRRKAQEEFAREQSFRRAIEVSVPSGIAAADQHGAHTYVNPAFCELVGYSEAELLGSRPPYPYWPPEEAAAIQSSIANLIQGNSAGKGLELRFRHRSGKLFDVLFLLNPMKDPAGQASGWLGSITDITERKRSEQRLRVQYEVARILSQSGHLQSALPEILPIIGGTMNWEFGAFWGTAPDRATLSCLAVWHKSPLAESEMKEATQHAVFIRGSGLPGRVLATGQPVWIADFSTSDFPRAKLAAREDFRGAFAFPVRFGGEVLGALEFFGRETRVEDETTSQWMLAIGNQIGQFIERETAEEALRRAHDELEKRVRERTADLMAANAELESVMRERKRLENELLEITEKERKRIGLDLHDDLGQRLAGLTLLMKGLELGLKKKKLPEAQEAGKIQSLIEQTVRHAGNLARDLAFDDLSSPDLPSALAALAARVEKLFGIACQFKTEGEIPPADRQVILQFCKIAQEAATNAVKHGKAAHVNITLTREDNHLVLKIRNDGLAFPSMIDQNRGMGLRIMNYRANVVGASLEVRPANRPKGTQVTCRLPLQAESPHSAAGVVMANGRH